MADEGYWKQLVAATVGGRVRAIGISSSAVGKKRLQTMLLQHLRSCKGRRNCPRLRQSLGAVGGVEVMVELKNQHWVTTHSSKHVSQRATISRLQWDASQSHCTLT